MPKQSQAGTLSDSLTEELRRPYGRQLTVKQIAGFVDAALADLRGSVAAEAFPEMAVRLARLRMDQFVSCALT